MASTERQRQFDAWKSRLLQAAVDDFEVVMTAIKTEDQSIMRLERLPKALVDYSKVHHVGGGPYKGILINKQASGLDEVVPEEARLEFLAYLSEQDGNSDPIQDYWVLKFWFQGTADGLKRKKIFTDYFQELMNPKNFPKNYIAFVKRALILLRRFEQIRRVDFVVQKSDDKSRDEELPPIKSFVTVYTPDSYTYQLVPEVQVNNKKFLAFKLKAGGDAHIALSAVYGDLDRKTHEIVIGAENNTKSMIRDGSMGIVKTEALTYSVLKAEEFRFFWISWADDHIEVGRGAHYGQGRFLSWKVPQYKRFNVNCLAVSTGRASRGQWEFAELLGQLPNLIVPQMRATESKQVYDQNPPVDDGTTRIFRTQSMMTIPSKAAGPRAVRRPVSHHDADSKAFEVDSNSSDSSRCESEQRDTRHEDLTPSRTEDLTPSRTEDLTTSRNEDLTPSRTEHLTPSRNKDLTPWSNEDAKVYTNVDTKLLGHEDANAFRNVGLEFSRYEEKKPMRNEDTALSSNEQKPWGSEETKLWRYAEKKPVRNEDTELSSNEQKPKGNVETQLSRYENMEPSVKQNGPVSHKNSRIFRTQSSLVISNQRPVSHGFNGTVTHTKVLRRPWTGRQVITESWTNSRVVQDPSYRGYPVPPPNGLTKPKTWVATPAFQRPKNTSDLFESWRRRESGSLTKAELEDRQWVTNHVYGHKKKPVSVRDKSWESSTFLHHSVKDNQKQDSLWSNGTDVTDTVSEKWSDHTYSSGKPSSAASEAFDPKRWSSYHSLPRNHKCYCVTTNMNSEGNALYRSGYSLPGKVITSSYNYKPSMLGPSNADISLQGFKPPDEMSGGKPDVDFDKAAKAARKQKAKMSLIWLAKRQKLIQVLEDAYPNSVPITKLLEACKIKQTDMISAVVMLKDLEKRELIREIENGLWMRIPKGPKDSKSDIEMVDRMPILGRSDQPTIAIITALYCEKLAVDAMMEDKKTYVRYRTEGESQVYTLGRIGRHNVVSTKLSRLGSGRNAMISAENTTTRLLGTFGHVEHVLLVGVGGAVPHFSDFSKHVRLGDVVISTPVDDSQTLYMQCTKVESMTGVSGYTYSTRSFSCMNQALQLVVQHLKRDFESGRVDKTFQSYIEDAKDSLDSEESSFHRPSIKSDQLFLVKPDGEKIRMEHPRPVGLQAKLYQEGQPFLRYGVIGAGRFVSRNDHMRREFAELNGIKAFDAEYDAVLHSLEGNRNDSLLVIRGMADYLDGSNKDWQPYAALVAAAYMKAVITALR